jgi:hypothetical protein
VLTTEKRCSQAFSADRLSGQDGSNEIIAQKSTNDMLLTHSISNSYDSAGIAETIEHLRKI